LFPVKTAFRKVGKKMKTALLIYWSKTGNTEKVAYAIKKGLEEASIQVTMKRPEEAEGIDYFDFDIVCVGAPSYSWHLPEQMTNFLKEKFAVYRQQGKIKPSAPKVPGKNALIFVTYSGPHTGIDEATPVGKDIGQYFEHIGFTIIEEWYILSEFHDSVENSTQGRMGDIRGKPTAIELQKIKENAMQVASLLT
jgi:flavodoxin